MERSTFMLGGTDHSVTEIWFDLGFTSLGTFSRTFREIVGETPSDYLVRHRPMVAPSCFQMAATRPGGSGAGGDAIEQFSRSRLVGGSLA